MTDILFTSYDGEIASFAFDTDIDNKGPSACSLTFASKRYNIISRLRITRFEEYEPENPGDINYDKNMPYYMIDCSNIGFLDGPEFCRNDRELCDWLRSFLYMHDADIVSVIPNISPFQALRNES